MRQELHLQFKVSSRRGVDYCLGFLFSKVSCIFFPPVFPQQGYARDGCAGRVRAESSQPLSSLLLFGPRPKPHTNLLPSIFFPPVGQYADSVLGKDPHVCFNY